MPQIKCPHCQHPMTIKSPKPGKYRPKCKNCGQLFSLTVSPNSDEAPVVRAIRSPASDEPTKERDPNSVDTKQSTSNQAARPPADAQSDDIHFAQTVAYDVGSEDPDSFSTRTQIPDATDPQKGNREDNPSGTKQPGADPTVLDRQAGYQAAQRHQAQSHPAISRLGGYRILSELGKGAMGTVYLAKQITLDREVAVKTIQAKWTQNPKLVARFMREAYSAAQLTHHNVVQIYDLGTDHGTHFFSMELIKGLDLKAYVEKNGPQTPKVAAIMILQAARGLAYAHRLGMVHRDIKPSNLMLSNDGIVKVTDLGLVKIPELNDSSFDESAHDKESLAVSGSRSFDGDLTNVNAAVGTPAYIAPEQSKNKKDVDQRADIYSLGCTLYTLLSGKPPFTGTSAIEIISKHQHEPMRPLNQVVSKDFPSELSEIVDKMTSKDRAKRYQSLEKTIADLRQFVRSIRTQKNIPAPPKVDPEMFQQLATSFGNTPFSKLQMPVILLSSLAGLTLGLLIMIFHLGIGSGMILGVLCMLLGLAVCSSLRDNNVLARRTREWLATWRWSDWLILVVGSILVFIAGLLLGSLPFWIVFALLGAGAGIGIHFLFATRIKQERGQSLEEIQKLLRVLRQEGDDETEIRQRMAVESGRYWEPAFESLFGYDAKIEMRTKLRDQGETGRAKSGIWLDPILKWMNRRVEAARLAKDIERLKSVEKAGLEAEGMNAEQAAIEAEERASAAVDQAMEIRIANFTAARSSEDSPAAVRDATGRKLDPSEARRARIKMMLADARSGRYSKRKGFAGFVGSLTAFMIDGKLRFLAGAALLCGCLLWVHQNGLVSGDKLKEVATDAIDNRDLSSVSDVEDAVDTEVIDSMKPLNVPVLGKFFATFNPGIAGCLLLFTSLFRGWRMTLFALPAAAVIVIAPAFGIPDVVSIEGIHVISAAIGLGIGFLGLVLGRMDDS